MQVRSKHPFVHVLVAVAAGIAAYMFADASESVRIILGLLADSLVFARELRCAHDFMSTHELLIRQEPNRRGNRPRSRYAPGLLGVVDRGWLIGHPRFSATAVGRFPQRLVTGWRIENF